MIKSDLRHMMISNRLIGVISLFVLCAFFYTASAQELPPRPVTLTFNNSQPLAFGAFSTGASGGTVAVAPGGTRSSTGDVVLLTMGFIYTPAMFYVTANQGTVLSLLVSPPVLLSSGANTISLQVAGSLPASPFVTTLPWPQQTTILVGGTLTIGAPAANPPGNYSGSFSITLIQE